MRNGGKKGASTSHGMRTKSSYRGGLSKDQNSFMAIGAVDSSMMIGNQTTIESAKEFGVAH